MLVPQTPKDVTYTGSDNTEVVTLANDLPFTIPHIDNPLTISFEFTVSIKEYYFTNEGSDRHQDVWMDYLQQLKWERKPVELMIVKNEDKGDKYDVAYSFNFNVILTDWSVKEDAEKDDDMIINVTFMDYYGQTNQELSETVQHHLINARRARGWRSMRGEEVGHPVDESGAPELSIPENGANNEYSREPDISIPEKRPNNKYSQEPEISIPERGNQD